MVPDSEEGGPPCRQRVLEAKESKQEANQRE